MANLVIFFYVPVVIDIKELPAPSYVLWIYVDHARAALAGIPRSIFYSSFLLIPVVQTARLAAQLYHPGTPTARSPFMQTVLAGWHAVRADMGFTPTNTTDPPPLPTGDLRQAEQHLKLAYDYHVHFVETDQERDEKNALRFASEHIEKARQINPKAFITVTNAKKEEEQVGVIQLSAAILFDEAQYRRGMHDYSGAIKCMIKSMNYQATSQYADYLAELYILNGQRDKALEVLLKDDNPSFKNLQLRDRLQINKQFGAKWYTKIRYIFAIMAIVTAFVGFMNRNVYLLIAGIVGYIIAAKYAQYRMDDRASGKKLDEDL